ncbi:hypothetical protein HG530_015549 [Fusarium avenaceum]|nr:hypothetical protein HG530_015549 [Fusarium avenaceum]
MENVQLKEPAKGFTEITDHKSHLRNAQANSHKPTKLCISPTLSIRLEPHGVILVVRHLNLELARVRRDYLQWSGIRNSNAKRFTAVEQLAEFAVQLQEQDENAE